ncbi:cytochrome b/b6 domain-containing protein [Microbacterium sp. 22195]|uniref:cytochrome b/b6 domain-containing protein n=1 Tax=Microbacterium sp. 22195 TaxID=3453891 RepID=UPI003F82C59C
MATRMLRRGLPRVKGGEAWPSPIEVEIADAVAVDAAAADAPAAGAAAAPAVADPAASSAPLPAESTGNVREQLVQSTGSGAVAAAEAGASASPAPSVPAAPGVAVPAGASLRRGLPRVAGGDPWPPASAAPAAAASSAPLPVESTAGVREQVVPSAASGAVDVQDAPVAAKVEAAPSAASDVPVAVLTDGAALRRGLPRVAGGDPWPPAGVARVAEASAVPAGAATEGAETASPGLTTQEAAPGATTQVAVVDQKAAAVASAKTDVSIPLPFTRTVWAGTAPRHVAQPEEQPSKLRPTWPQAIGGLLGLFAAGLLAVSAVFLVRTFLSTSFMQDFLTTYPGEYHVDVAPGFAPWVGWQHFFNMFLMVLIIRSGLRVRTEKRPTAFWTPRGQKKSKISLTLWFHQSLDLLWMINGVVFVVLLFSTGHWLRLVPTSWEVFPNALSAGLQYVSFDWPTDNGWVNYNSLQQLAYFTTVFLAAPLAAITGFRMSGLWPKKAEKLSKAYPIEWARAVHFPVMLYFVAFIVVHVALVFLTGALRNLNHMFASMGSVDGVEYAANWTGFWAFVLAIAVIVAGWFAARPLVLAPIARLFGQVSGR